MKSTRKKLTEDQVRFVRKHYFKGALGYKYFAKKLNISVNSIKAIVRGSTWKDVV